MGNDYLTKEEQNLLNQEENYGEDSETEEIDVDEIKVAESKDIKQEIRNTRYKILSAIILVLIEFNVSRNFFRDEEYILFVIFFMIALFFIIFIIISVKKLVDLKKEKQL